MSPFFSIIIPTYNRWSLLCEALTSVAHQTCQDFEVLIVDDGSCDGTRERLQQLQGPIRLFYAQRYGPAGARNVALREALGTYVAFLDSDDRWLPNHLADAITLIRHRPEVDFLFADTRFIRAIGVRDSYLRGKPIEHVPFEAEGSWRVFSHTIYPELVREPTIATSSAIVRRHLLTALQGFNERLMPFGEDTDLWLRLCAEAKAAGNWTVTVERRKLGDNLVDSGQDMLRLAKELQLLHDHAKGCGRLYRPTIRQRLVQVYAQRARVGLRQHAYGVALGDVGYAIQYSLPDLMRHVRTFSPVRCRPLLHRLRTTIRKKGSTPEPTRGD